MRNIFSIIILIFICFRGFTYLSQGKMAFGAIMLGLGIFGLGFRLYEITKNRNKEE